MKKSVFLVGCVIFLTACVSEPIDPAFRGSAAIDKGEAAKTRVSLGLTYLKNGNFAQAKSNLDRALKFDPRSSDAHFAMAFYFQQVEEAGLAEQYYESALSLSDNDPDIVNSYGVFLCQQGKYDKARKYFLEAVNAKSYAATAETYENLAICTQSQGDIEGAIEYFNSALNHQPTRAKTLFMLTNIYVEQGKWENAKKTLRRYERSAPVSVETFNLNYQIAKGMGDMKTALGYGELLVRSYPGHEYTKAYMADIGKFKSSTKTKTAQVAQAAQAKMTSQPPAVIKDSGIENSSSIETKASDTPTKTITRKSPTTETLTQEVSATTSQADQTAFEQSETDDSSVPELEVAEEEGTISEPVETAESVTDTSTSPETVEETMEDVEQLSDDTTLVATNEVLSDSEETVLQDEAAGMTSSETEAETDNELNTASASNSLEETVNSEQGPDASKAEEAEQLDNMIDEFAGGVEEPSEDAESSRLAEDVIEAEDAFAEVSVPEASEEGLSLPEVDEEIEQGSVIDEPVQALAENEIEVKSDQADIVEESEPQLAEGSDTSELSILEEETEENAPPEQQQMLVDVAEDNVTEEISQNNDINDTIPEEVEAQQAIEDTDQAMVASLSSPIDDGWHVVQRKENLYRISIKYNVTMAKLMEWNGITDASDIQWGTRLRVKEPSGNE